MSDEATPARTSPLWTLHQGDAFERLPTLADQSFGIVLTDTPFNAHVHKKQRKIDRTKKRGFKETPLDFAPFKEWQRLLAAHHFARLATRWVILFSAHEDVHLWRAACAAEGLQYFRTLPWIKTDPTPYMVGDGPGNPYESIAIFKQPGRSHWNGGGRCPVYTFRAKDAARTYLHETEKPVPLCEAILRDFADPGERILDPFAGSGSIAVAATRLGLPSVSIELSATSYADARDRLLANDLSLDVHAYRRGQQTLFPAP